MLWCFSKNTNKGDIMGDEGPKALELLKNCGKEGMVLVLKFECISY